MASYTTALRIIFLVSDLAFILFSFILQESLAFSTQPKVLLISFDGFRYDYLDKASTPNFDKLKHEGVWLKKGVKSSYPTKTFPNHYTMVTGLFVESHGMVGNKFYDPVFHDDFSLIGDDAGVSKWWDAFDAEPIWVTNQIQEQSVTNMSEPGNWIRRTGVVFWPGSEAEIKDVRPFHFSKYNLSLPFEDRVSMILEYFKDPTHPINLGLLYLSEPDWTAHSFGPNSPEVAEQIKILDDLVGMLIKKLKALDLWGRINIIFTADHGMSQLAEDRLINLEDYGLNEFNETDYMFYGSNPIWHVWPTSPEAQMLLLERLRNIEHLMTFSKDEMPEDYHYKNNRRIPPISIEAEPGWTVDFRKDLRFLGAHGYNNSLPEMRPFFIAVGPAFKANLTSEKVIDNVDIFPLMCHLLDLETPPNNGSLRETRFMLKERNEPSSDRKEWQFVTAIVGVLTIVVVSTGVTIWWCRRKSKSRSVGQYGL